MNRVHCTNACDVRKRFLLSNQHKQGSLPKTKSKPLLLLVLAGPWIVLSLGTNLGLYRIRTDELVVGF